MGAAERIVRALVFACVYSLFVYISSPANSQCGGTVVCIMRASAASVWVLGAAFPLLLCALPQCGIAIWARLRTEDEQTERTPMFYSAEEINTTPSKLNYNQLATRTPPPEANEFEIEDDETRSQTHTDGAAHCAHTTVQHPHREPSPPRCVSFSASSNALSRNIGPLMFRQVGPHAQSQPAHSSSSIASKERMAEIAASMTEPEC